MGKAPAAVGPHFPSGKSACRGQTAGQGQSEQGWRHVKLRASHDPEAAACALGTGTPGARCEECELCKSPALTESCRGEPAVSQLQCCRSGMESVPVVSQGLRLLPAEEGCWVTALYVLFSAYRHVWCEGMCWTWGKDHHGWSPHDASDKVDPPAILKHRQHPTGLCAILLCTQGALLQTLLPCPGPGTELSAAW